MARWDYSFNYRHLELVLAALMQWNERVKDTISNERIPELERGLKRKLSGELSKLIQEIREEMNWRKI